MVEWFGQNMQWLLSGVFVAVPLFVLGYWLRRSKGEKTINIKQKSGRNSQANIVAVTDDITVNQNAKGSASATVKSTEQP